jgi:hypothetical protein
MTAADCNGGKKYTKEAQVVLMNTFSGSSPKHVPRCKMTTADDNLGKNGLKCPH